MSIGRASQTNNLFGARVGREGEDAIGGIAVGLTDQRFTRETHSGAPRRSGAPLAAMHEVLTLSVCKRRDAVRLGMSEAARPPGAAFGVSSGATSSWAARLVIWVK